MVYIHLALDEHLGKRERVLRKWTYWARPDVLSGNSTSSIEMQILLISFTLCLIYWRFSMCLCLVPSVSVWRHVSVCAKGSMYMCIWVWILLVWTWFSMRVYKCMLIRLLEEYIYIYIYILWLSLDCRCDGKYIYLCIFVCYCYLHFDSTCKMKTNITKREGLTKGRWHIALC